MGVPSFYRWLVGKYPKSVVDARDEGENCDCNSLNPNGEFDNFYLDMNGIVHACFHPEDELSEPTTFDEVFISIFNYIDCLFRIVRPRKLLFIAVDGVAPRAKMNQQRARRYKTAKDTEIAEIEEKRLRSEFEKQGKELLPKKESSQLSDSNVITPGTVFMQKLSVALEYYIRLRLNKDLSWKSIMVILSDANVPGEGEHKIMSFVRLQRSLSSYDHNTRHCIYGLDADLIMLALATHEIHFCVLREVVLNASQEINISSFISNTSQKEQDIFKTREWFKQIKTSSTYKRAQTKPYQFINIWTLREYLELDMKPEFESVTGVERMDIERIVDDFIFICFFTGNDFLPHLPSIEIHEGGIDLLIAIYKKEFKSMGGYLIDTSRMNEDNNAYINFQRLKKFIIELGSYEDKIFVKRYTLRKKKLEKLLQERENVENDQIDFCNLETNDMQTCLNCKIGVSEQVLDSFSNNCIISSSVDIEASLSIQSDVFENAKEFKRMLKQFLRDKSDLFKNGFVDNDKVRLGCPGWKARYYKEKFSAENGIEVEAIRTVLVQKYVEGLCWVLKYYFTGVCSWSWYYPFNYSPFASDFKNLCWSKVTFTAGMPFEPFDQLMAVLPPMSSHALPKAYRSLMINDDSPIHYFYPVDFMVDNDGKRFAWQGICKLPFIEEHQLIEETKKLREELQVDEVERNCISSTKAFFMDSTSVLTQSSPHSHASEKSPNEAPNHVVVEPCCGLIRFISRDKCVKCGSAILNFTSVVRSEDMLIDISTCGLSCFISSDKCHKCAAAPSNFISPVEGSEDILSDKSRLAMLYIQEPQLHKTRLLRDVNIPEKTIQSKDIVQKTLWHEYPGYFPPHSIQPQKFPPETSHLPVNETWKGSRQGWSGVGHGKSVAEASLLGVGTKHAISPSAFKGNTTCINYERGHFSAVSSVSASTSCNQFQSMADRSNDWRHKLDPVASNWGMGRGMGRGRGTHVSSYYASQNRGRGTQVFNSYESQVHARGTPVFNSYESQVRARGTHIFNSYESQVHARGTQVYNCYPSPGPGQGTQVFNSYLNQDRGHGAHVSNSYVSEGRGRGTQVSNSYLPPGRGRGIQSWVPRKSEPADSSIPK